ncbi:MAG TPA: hypothetical protein VLT36_20405 [Candidatus Dormibacteraeota bacterium]|nr:hypothetical protein [Candidatus Dormibacteraeota bacterium]
MNREEAKEILLLYRPGSADEPEFAEALNVATQDPELDAWFKQHCAFQEQVSGAFNRIQVPEGLKEQILSERKAHFSLGIGKKVAAMSLCVAVLAVLLGLAHFYFTPKEDNTLANFRARMIGEKIIRMYPNMDSESDNQAEIRRYLAQHGGQTGYVLPNGLEKTTPTGCAIFPWHGKRVSMVCFNSGRNGTPKVPDLFLFIVDSRSVNDLPATGNPDLAKVSGLATASWTKGDKAYVLATSRGEDVLKESL